MSPDDQQLATIGCALCTCAERIDAWSRPLALLALAGILLPGASDASSALLAGSAILALIQLYFALRLAFDQPIFAAWARQPNNHSTTLAAFDAALSRLGWPVASPGRTLAERVTGTQVLFRRQRLAFAAQLAAAVGALLLLSLH